MGRKPTGRPRGRPRKPPIDAEGFGFTPPDRDPPAKPPVESTPQEILDLGMPPEDAAGIQKYNYRMLSTLAALALRNESVPFDQRMRRFIQATTAAARHFPTAVQYELVQKIEADAAAIAGRKKAKAAARLETTGAAGSAKVIPIRPVDAQDA